MKCPSWRCAPVRLSVMLSALILSLSLTASARPDQPPNAAAPLTPSNPSSSGVTHSDPLTEWLTDSARVARSTQQRTPVSRQALKRALSWWGVGKVDIGDDTLGDLTITSPLSSHSHENPLIKRRSASALVLSDAAPLALAPMILSRAIHRLERRHLYGLKIRARLSTQEPRSDHEALRGELEATSRYLSGLLSRLSVRGRPSAQLIRAARESARLIQTWRAGVSAFSHATPDRAPYLTLEEIERLDCQLSALIDLKRRRVSALRRCTDSPSLALLTTHLMLLITQDTTAHHRLTDLSAWARRLRDQEGEAPHQLSRRAYAAVISELAHIKLIGRRRMQIVTLLREAFKLGGEARIAAIQVARAHNLTELRGE